MSAARSAAAPPPARARARAWRALCGALLLGGACALAQGMFSEARKREFAARYGAPAARRLDDWERLIAGAGSVSEGDKLERVNRFFNGVRFLQDADHWGRRDYWATPLEMLGTDGGDCEDFSIAKYVTLRQLGVPDARLRITYVRAPRLAQTHMVLAYYASPGAEPLILDNLIDEIRPGSRRRDLIPVYSFNGEGLWRAVARGQGRRLGGAGRLDMWRDVTRRMRSEGVLPAAETDR